MSDREKAVIEAAKEWAIGVDKYRTRLDWKYERELREAVRALNSFPASTEAVPKEWTSQSIPAMTTATVTCENQPPAIPLDPNRCAVCGWPLAEMYKTGCHPGYCYTLPERRPTTLYDPERAAREAKEKHG